MDNLKLLEEKAYWVKCETLKLHKLAPGTRIASSVSDLEIFVTLYYGNILKYDAKNPAWEERDRLIVSKGHGGVSLYPILADLGFFSMTELSNINKENSLLCDIPDNIPGFETINGSLGHGPGVGAGMALGLRTKNSKSKVVVLVGDGELYEGSIWEAIMFAGHNKLDNLIMIVDFNKISMLDFTKNLLDLEPLADKFKAFNWQTYVIDGHNFKDILNVFKEIEQTKEQKPKVILANTVKGKGIPQLENDALCHIKSLKADDVDSLLAKS